MDSPSDTQSPAQESPTTNYLLNLSPLSDKPMNSPKFSDADLTNPQSGFTSPPTGVCGQLIFVNRHNGDEGNTDVYGQADIKATKDSVKLQSEQANDEYREGKGLAVELASVDQGEVKEPESSLESAKIIWFQGDVESCDTQPIVFSKKTVESDMCSNTVFEEQQCLKVTKQEACHQQRGTCRQLDYDRTIKNWQTSQISTNSATNLGLQEKPSDLENVAAISEQRSSSTQKSLNTTYSQSAFCDSLIPVWRTDTGHTMVGSVEKIGHSFMLAPVSSEKSISAITSSAYLADGRWGSVRLVRTTSAPTQFDKDMRPQGDCPNLTINSQRTSSPAGEQSASRTADRFNYSNQASSTKKRMKPTNIDKTEGCGHCNCKRTKCLKLYCDCFAAGFYCDDLCACQSCTNKPDYEDTVHDVRELVTARNPLAFTSKVVLETGPPANNNDWNQATPVSARHRRGCNCKKSTCVKKYCECYQAGVGCSIGCCCQGCKNSFGTREDALYESAARSDSLQEELDDVGTLKFDSRSHCIPSNTVPSHQELDSRKVERPDQFSTALEEHSPLCHISHSSHPHLYASNFPENSQHHTLDQNDSKLSGSFPWISSSVDHISPLDGRRGTPEIQAQMFPPGYQSHDLGLNSSEALKGSYQFISESVPSLPPQTPFSDSKTVGDKQHDFDPGGTVDNQ